MEHYQETQGPPFDTVMAEARTLANETNNVVYFWFDRQGEWWDYCCKAPRGTPCQTIKPNGDK